MTGYRIRIRLTAPLATPLHSGTLFGHLCWARRYQEGERSLVAWLKALPDAPLLLSDALPADCLPRPLLAPAEFPAPDSDDKRALLSLLQKQKKARKVPHLGISDFLELRDAFSERRLLALLGSRPPSRAGPVASVRQPHNAINRRTGTTPESGGLYFMDEQWHGEAAADWDIYLQGAVNADQVRDWFTQIGQLGFGRDASLGRGQFTVEGIGEADPRLFGWNGGNRLLSLSHGSLTPSMRAPRYKLHTHYGKLGGLFGGTAHSPFKYPLSLLAPGATFAPGEGPYGELLTGVHPHRPETCHNAWHLCIPFTEAV
jgi:CRISPR-associated protein Csm4